MVFLVFFQRLTQNLTLNLSGVNLDGPPEMTEDESDGDDDDTLPLDDAPAQVDTYNNNHPLFGSLRPASSAPTLSYDPVPSTSAPVTVQASVTKDVKSTFKLAAVTTPLKALTEAAVGTITRSARKKLELQRQNELKNVGNDGEFVQPE